MGPEAGENDQYLDLSHGTSGNHLWPLITTHRLGIRDPPRILTTLQDQGRQTHQSTLEERRAGLQCHDLHFNSQNPTSTTDQVYDDMMYSTAYRDTNLPALHSTSEFEAQTGTRQWSALDMAPTPSPGTLPTLIQFPTSDPNSQNIKTPAARVQQRRPRKKQPADALWNRHQDEIKSLYIQQNLSLDVTMRQMEENHGFEASEKMYKDRFKLWKWFKNTKNLPREKAMWMVQRANQRKPKDTVFEWGNQSWTIDKIKKTNDRVYRDVDAQDEDGVHVATTPKDITYKTPDASPAAEVQSKHSSRSHEVPFCTSKLGESIDEGPFHVDLKTTSIEDIKNITRAATASYRRGNDEEAESWFLEALSCFSRVLSPTDDETLKVGYQLASFYADHGRTDCADEVLNWMSAKHKRHLGANHDKSLQHFGRVVELLRNWSRQEYASLFLYRVLNSINDLNLLDLNVTPPQDDKISGRSLSEQANIQGLASLPNHKDEITLYVKRLDKLTMHDEPILLQLLPRLIQRCEDSSDTLTEQCLELKCRLATAQAKQNDHEGARKTLKDSGIVLFPQLEKEQEVPHRLVQLGQRLAFAHFEAGDATTCDDILDSIAERLERMVGIQNDEDRDILVIDFFISLAAQNSYRSTWERCRPWLERALGLSVLALGPRHKNSKSLERMLETGRFESTVFEGLDDFMNSSGRMFKFRIL